MERETRFELATFALARQRSTTEPFPQSGGNNRARTYDPLLVRQMLSQLSYASKPELLVYNTKLKKKLQLFFGGFSKKNKKIKKIYGYRFNYNDSKKTHVILSVSEISHD